MIGTFRMGVIAAAVRSALTIDPYADNVALLLHMDGANAGTTFTDSSRNAHAVTAVGNAQTSTSQLKFGTASLTLDGVGDYLSIGGTSIPPSLDLVGRDFTIEGWVRKVGTGNLTLFTERDDDVGTSGVLIYIDSSGLLNARFDSGSGPNTITTPGSPTPIPLNTWKHVAVTRSSTTVRLFVDGVLLASNTSTLNLHSNPTGYGIRIGSSNDGAGQTAVNIDDFRITVGVARYTANFTPPAAAYSDPPTTDPYFSSVKLLLHMNGANTGTTFTDNSPSARTATATGVTTSTTQNMFGSASGLCGTSAGGGLQFAASPDFATDTEYTLEWWMYLTSAADVFFMAASATRYFSMNTSRFLTATNYGPTGGATIPLNTWTHIAMARDAGGTVRFFVDGALIDSASFAGDSSSLPFNIFGVPGRSDLASFTNGYIDEVRFTRKCRYTAAFVRPAAPFPDVGPSGAYRYWRLRDIQVNLGFLEITELQLFNGTTRVDGTGSLTSSSAPGFGSVSDLQDGDMFTRAYWTEATAEAAGFTLTFDLGSATFVTGLKIGAYDNSSRFPTDLVVEVSNDGVNWFRKAAFTNITYPGNSTLTPLLAFPNDTARIHMESSGPTEDMGHPVSLAGGASASSVYAAAGTSSALVSGSTSGGYVLVGPHADTAYWNNDFTIEGFFKFVATTGTVGNCSIFCGVDGNSLRFHIDTSRGVLSLNGTNLFVTNGFSPSRTQAHHLAITRKGNVWRWFFDGVLMGTSTTPVTYTPPSTSELKIGNGVMVGEGMYVDEWRIHPACLYVRDFAVPSLLPFAA